jgi:hypothetical protein
MRRNADFDGHQEAMNLSRRGTYHKVSDCTRCGHAIAWLTSKSGKRYPAEVTIKQGGGERDGDALRVAPWKAHTREVCERNIAGHAEFREQLQIDQDRHDGLLCTHDGCNEKATHSCFVMTDGTPSDHEATYCDEHAETIREVNAKMEANGMDPMFTVPQGIES